MSVSFLVCVSGVKEALGEPNNFNEISYNCPGLLLRFFFDNVTGSFADSGERGRCEGWNEK